MKTNNKIIFQLPVHPILFAIFPIISLMGHNSGQISLEYIVRPLLFSIIFTIIFMVLVRLFMKDWRKVVLIVTPTIITISSFGILFDLIKDRFILGVSLNHRYGLVFFLGLILVVIVASVAKSKKNLKIINQFLVISGLVAVFIPSIRIIYNIITSSRATISTDSKISAEDLAPTISNEQPDIYYFILDGYSRADQLKKTFKFDNSNFIHDLEKKGFYIAQCSRSNYSNTRLSLASSLNMSYLSDIAPELTPDIQNISAVNNLIHYNKVRADLKSLGYKDVSFQTGYLFSEFHDADYYIKTSSISLNQPFLTPFEKLLFNATVFKVLDIIPAVQSWSNTSSLYGNYLMDKNKISLMNNLDLPSPKFVFIHLTPAHYPYMFTPNGDLQEDERFYSKDNGWPVSQGIGRKGYLNGIMYLNSALLPIIENLQSSKNPPIIIIQADHGNMIFKQQEILSAYFFPDQDYRSLYSNISPVNSFRVVFNKYFNQTYPLLPDRSFSSGLVQDPFEITETKEKFSSCIID